MRTTPTKLGATLTLVGILVTLFGISYLRDGIHGLAGSFASPAGPKFKVEYGYFMIPALDCPGGRCQQPTAQRLKGPVAGRAAGRDQGRDRQRPFRLRPGQRPEGHHDELRGRELRHIALRSAEGPDSDRQGRKHVSLRVTGATDS